MLCSAAVNILDESEYIDLPVGEDIKNHVIFTLKFTTRNSMAALASTQFTSPTQRHFHRPVAPAGNSP
jgi:cellobiose dehydrogenase (acceptor)